MEELRELARVQATISLLATHSLSSPDAAHDVFLAKFLLFSVKVCKDVDDMAGKWSFVASKLQQICSSSAFLQDLYKQQNQGINEKTKMKDSNFMSLSSRGTLCADNVNREVVSISYNDLERANSTLEDFCRSYFMFHEMNCDNARDLFKHLPILAFVESYIYQMDEKNESQLLSSSWGSPPQGEPQENVMVDAFCKEEEKFLQPLRKVLARKSLWTTRIEEELRSGLEYWRLEQSLCSSIASGGKITVSNVMRAIKLKSFDYRVLNLVLCGLLNQPVNEVHMEFLSVSEVLVEIADDLFDYEVDVLSNSFNILRMLLKIYGPTEAPCKLAQMITEAEERYSSCLKNLEPSLALRYQKRCEEAVLEGRGSCSSCHPMGSWTIPPLILNEGLYREQVRLGGTPST